MISDPGVYAGLVHACMIVHAFLIGDAFDNGLSFALGRTHVQKYLPTLLQHIEDGALQPDVIISHRMNLSDAARGHEMFEAKQDECRKIILTR